MNKADDFIVLTNRLQKLFQERDESYTLCIVQGKAECSLLRYIYKEGRDVPMKEIAAGLKISKPNVTRVISNLVDRGLVERFHSGDDRRNCFARITTEGAKIAKNTKYRLSQFQKDVLKRIPPKKIDDIYDKLMIFINAYESVIKDSRH